MEKLLRLNLKDKLIAFFVIAVTFISWFSAKFNITIICILLLIILCEIIFLYYARREIIKRKSNLVEVIEKCLSHKANELFDTIRVFAIARCGVVLFFSTTSWFIGITLIYTGDYFGFLYGFLGSVIAWFLSRIIVEDIFRFVWKNST